MGEGGRKRGAGVKGRIGTRGEVKGGGGKAGREGKRGVEMAIAEERDSRDTPQHNAVLMEVNDVKPNVV